MSRIIGNIIECYANDTFNLLPASFNDYYDAMLLNIPIEIKGILKHPNDERHKNGRVWITNKNHIKLLKNNGMYLFIVYEYKEDVYEYNIIDYTDIDIYYVIFIAAHRIKINSGTNTKISYKKLLGVL
jgi:hypothetical protein